MLQWMVENNIHEYIAFASLILMLVGIAWLLIHYMREVLLTLLGTVTGASVGGIGGVVVVSCLYWIAQVFKYLMGEQILLFSDDLADTQLFVAGLLGIIGGAVGLLISLAVIVGMKTSDSSKRDDLNSKSVSK